MRDSIRWGRVWAPVRSFRRLHNREALAKRRLSQEAHSVHLGSHMVGGGNVFRCGFVSVPSGWEPDWKNGNRHLDRRGIGPSDGFKCVGSPAGGERSFFSPSSPPSPSKATASPRTRHCETHYTSLPPRLFTTTTIIMPPTLDMRIFGTSKDIFERSSDSSQSGGEKTGDLTINTSVGIVIGSRKSCQSTSRPNT